jgi:hypothetical protein
MSNQQSTSKDQPVSPLTPIEHPVSFSRDSFEEQDISRASEDRARDTFHQNFQLHHYPTFGSKTGQFTPASTLRPDDESWTKGSTAKIHVDPIAESQLPKQFPRKTQRRKFSWTWQVLSAALSVAGLLGTIILLIFIDRRPRLSDWTLSSPSNVSPATASNVSPNTLVAVFSAISKGALLAAVADGIGQLKWIRFEQQSHLLEELEVYDEASRGPWGALKLMIRTKQTALLASFGAFITVFSLALDPFSQQVISHVTGTVLASHGSASFQIARTYDTGLTSFNAANSGTLLFIPPSSTGSGSMCEEFD